MVKSFKKPVNITLKFIINLSLIFHNPQCEIFTMLTHAVACNPFNILKESCSGNNFSKQLIISTSKFFKDNIIARVHI